MRFKMYCMMKKLDRFEDDYLSGDEIAPFIKTAKDRRALRALKAIGAVKLEYADDEICAIIRHKVGILYELERSDLWFARIISFVLGVMSSIAVEYVIRYMIS